MKVEIKEKEQEFKPIKLEITIESKEELHELWHRLNIAPCDLEPYATGRRIPFNRSWNFTYSLWDEINNLLNR